MRLSLPRPDFGQIIALLITVMMLLTVGCSSQSNASSASTSPTPTVAAISMVAPLPSGKYQTTTLSNLAYGSLAGEQLDLCVPKNAPGKHPLVIFIHGGGWASGDKSQYTSDLCPYLATLGYVAASLNYRLAPTNHWPAQIIDAQLAVRWLRTKAETYAIDTSRICSWGDSAGAQMALYLGSDTSIHAGDEAGVLSNQSPQTPTCVIDYYGPTDMTRLANANTATQVLDALFGATLNEQPALYRDASPIFLLTKNSPPTFIAQGSNDTLVPSSQSQTLQSDLQNLNVPVQYASYKGDHAFLGASDQEKHAILQQTIQFLLRYEQP